MGVVAEGRLLPSLRELFQIALTFSLTCFAWVFFRAENLHHAFGFLSRFFSDPIFVMPEKRPVQLLIIIALFFSVEWIGRSNKHALESLAKINSKKMRWFIYVLVFMAIVFYGAREQKFIYFNF